MRDACFGGEAGRKQARDGQKYFCHTGMYPCKIAADSIRGDKKAMARTNRLAMKCVDDMSDNVPVIAHVKGTALCLLGKRREGQAALVAGTKMAVVVPVALVVDLFTFRLLGDAAQHGMERGIDNVVTKIVSATEGEYVPSGFVFAEHLDKINSQLLDYIKELDGNGLSEKEISDRASIYYCDELEKVGIKCDNHAQVQRAIRKRLL